MRNGGRFNLGVYACKTPPNHRILWKSPDRRCSGLRSRERGRLGVREPGQRFAPYGASSSPTHLLAAVPDAERHAGRKTQVPEVHEVGLEPKRHALGEMDVNPAARLKGESLFDISSRNVRRYVLLVYQENHRLSTVGQAHAGLSEVALKLRLGLPPKTPMLKTAIKAERAAFDLKRSLQRLEVKDVETITRRAPVLPEVRRGGKVVDPESLLRHENRHDKRLTGLPRRNTPRRSG